MTDNIDINKEETNSDAYVVSEEKAEEITAEAAAKASENDELTPEEKKALKKKNIIKEIISWVMVVVIAFVLAKLLTTYVIIKAEVPTGSMLETIQKGDLLIGNRLAYVFGEPERGDIVIFYLPDNPSEIYIKRCIGVGGDHIEIIDGKVYLNYSKEPLDEPYLREEMIGSYGPYDVPENCYFMLGDNRNGSLDARFWVDKYVNEDLLIAKAWFRYYPSIGSLE